MKRKKQYPGIYEAERERSKKHPVDDEPDWIGNAPNYEKFDKLEWDTERVLVWLNID